MAMVLEAAKLHASAANSDKTDEKIANATRENKSS